VGCGDRSLEASTAPLAAGTRVSPQRYLADAAAAAAAVNDFSSILEEIAPTAGDARLRAIAPRLAAAFTRSQAMAGRIDGQRLEDRRLEAQRAAAATSLNAVVMAMDRVVVAARAGRAVAVADAADGYATRVGALRNLPPAS
jgi:hypothetical protein